MVEVLFAVLLQGLKLANSKESTKYLDEVMKLQKEWMEEYAKPRKDRSNANLDQYELDLVRISKLFTSSFRNENS